MISLDIAISRGEFHLAIKAGLDSGISAIFGPSGSGKSTTLACIAGLVRPDNGSIVLDGESLFNSNANVHVSPENRSVGLVFQDGALFPHLDVRGNIEFGARYGSGDDRKVSPDQLMRLLDIFDLASRNIADLSGGERQMLAIARALIASPKFLMLDEPTATLSLKYQQQIIGCIDGLREDGVTGLLVEQNARLSLARFDHGCIFSGGKVVHTAKASEILDDPVIGAYFRG